MVFAILFFRTDSCLFEIPAICYGLYGDPKQYLDINSSLSSLLRLESEKMRFRVPLETNILLWQNRQYET